MTKFFQHLIVLMSTALYAQSAYADEVRLGVMVHDAKFFESSIFGGKHGKEESVSISGEYVWETPVWAQWGLGAKPYAGGTWNLGGKTSHGGAGVLWRKGVFEQFYGELAFGLVVHNGAVRTPDPLLTQDLVEITIRRRRKTTEIEFGSRVLFRTQFALGRRFNEKWAGELVYEHLSHGQILGGPENEGSNNVGMRIARRF